MSDIDDLMERMQKLQEMQDRGIAGVDSLLESTNRTLSERQSAIDRENDEYLRRREEEKRALIERMRRTNNDLDDALSAYNDIAIGK